MLKEQKPYLIVCLTISSIALFTIYNYSGSPISIFPATLRSFLIPLFLISIILVIVYGFKSTSSTYRSALFTLLVFFFLNVLLVSEVVAFEVHKYKLTQLEKMDTCEKAVLQFETDLKSGSLKYFTFGLGVDEEYQDKLQDQFDLDVYHMGCVVTESFTCYDELVEKHFGDTFRKLD